MAETVIACLTPVGKAALATLGLRGPDAWAAVRELFQPLRAAALPEAPVVGRFWYGRVGDEAKDEVVLAVKDAEWLELHCHGGPEVVRLLQEAFARRGVRVGTWQELERGPAWRVQAQELLASAPTVRTAAILLDQLHGAFHKGLETIRAALRTGDAGPLRELAALVPLGRHLVEPWDAVIAGAPNVGKSSLVNALAGYARCVVSPTPGTTRDAVATTLAIDGWPVRVTDTAGLRDAPEALEGEGIARARQAIAAADLRLWVLDGSAAPVLPEERAGWVFVVNKVDLPPAWDWNGVGEALRVSAHTREGLAELCAAISAALVPRPPGQGRGVPFMPALAEAVERALRAAEEGRYAEAELVLGEPGA